MTLAVYRRSERQRHSSAKPFRAISRRRSSNGSPRIRTKLTLGGEAREVTALFSDVRGFTRRCEGLSADAVVTFLNQIHTPLTQAVLAEAGTIDKYFGDGLMAFWNAPLEVPKHASRACRAALAMQNSMPALNRSCCSRPQSEPYQPIDIGIGINIGEVFVGNMGAEQRFDYSIVGDPVNVAARLEAATKEFDVPILVSKAVADAAAGLSVFAARRDRSQRQNRREQRFCAACGSKRHRFRLSCFCGFAPKGARCNASRH